MIPCSNEMYYKRNRKKGKRFLSFLITILILFCLFLYSRNCITENVFNITEEYSKKILITSCNESVLNLSVPLKYNEIITVEKDNNGNISFLTVNSLNVNKICNGLVNDVQKNVDNLIVYGVPVPILAFSGIPILNGYGKRVNIKNINISNISCSFDSKFMSMGINQTIHSIYADISCEANIIAPLNNRKMNFETEILLCETVIVGKIPNTYLDGKIF